MLESAMTQHHCLNPQLCLIRHKTEMKSAKLNFMTTLRFCRNTYAPHRLLSSHTTIQRNSLYVYASDQCICKVNGAHMRPYIGSQRYRTSFQSNLMGTCYKFISTVCSQHAPQCMFHTTSRDCFTTLRSAQMTDHALHNFKPRDHFRGDHTFHTDNSCPEIILNVKCRQLEIISGSSMLKIPFVWLRDHCRSERCYNHQTGQKVVDVDLLRRDLIPSAVNFTPERLGIIINWKDGHVSKFTFEFLINNFYPGRISRRTPRLLWDKAVIGSEPLPVVPYSEHMMKESGLKQTLRNLVRYGFTIVNEVPSSLERTQEVAERISSIYETIFGRMWTLTADSSRSDTAYSNGPLRAHTDNTYMSTPSGIQIFHGLEHDGSGGETLLVDGFNAIETLHLLDPAAFRILNKTVVPHEYKESPSENSPGYHLYSLGTVITTHPASGELVQIRFNPYDRAPLNTVAPDDIEAFYEAYDKLSQIINNPDSGFWVKLQPGSVLFLDNWRVMHGRAGFDGRRVLCGCYLPRDEWTSKARLMGIL